MCWLIRHIYSEGRYEKGNTGRSHKVGDRTFNEEILPVESVAEYFKHFPLLEIDHTFYRLLLEKDGKPTQNFHVLKNYRQHMKEGGLLLLKVPQVIIAWKLRRRVVLSRMMPTSTLEFSLSSFMSRQWIFSALAYMGSFYAEIDPTYSTEIRMRNR